MIEMPPWYQAWTKISRPGTGMIDPLWGDAILLLRLRSRPFVVASEAKLAVYDIVDGIGAPGAWILHAASRA